MKKSGFLALLLVITFIPVFKISSLAADYCVIKTISAVFENSIGCSCSIRVFGESADFEDVYYIDEKKVGSDGTVSFDVAFDNKASQYRYILKTSMGESAEGIISVESEQREEPKEAYYVLDEDFSMPRCNEDESFTRIAWDLLEGTAAAEASASDIWYGANNGLWFVDRKADSRVSVQRTFEKLTDCFIMAEMRLGITDASKDGWGFSLSCGSDEAVRATVQNGGLYFGNTRVADFRSGKIGLRVELDLEQRSYDVFINGNKVGSALKSALGSIDNIKYFTSEEGVGNLYTGPVRIAKGYYVSDEFVSYTEGASLSAISEWKSQGNVRVISSKGTPAGDIYSLAMSAGIEAPTLIEQTFTKRLTNEEVITFKAYSPNGYINMLNIDAGDFKAKIQNNGFYVKNKNGSYDYVCDVPKNIWNTFRITANCVRGAATVQINGKEKAYGLRFSGANCGLDKISFISDGGSGDIIWLDDIYVFDAPQESADYPQEPAKLQKSESDVLVGIQTCDLWHEGKHFGWDKIANYPKKISYLGLYDDGSAEVKDWEIKWLVEHGIDYTAHCWYRPGDIGEPIKEPRNGYSVHDGYFNAKYKDKIKFMIAWENAGFKLSGSLTQADMLSDFKENIVPFWVEYYFKDPGYLRVDNRAMINIYNISTLRSAFGDDGLKEAVAYLKDEVKKAGYDGIYLIGTTSSSNASVLQEYKDFGYDAVYCYSYGVKNNTFVRLQNEIMRQKENDVISYIPTISMGFDPTSWNRDPGGILAPDAVGQLARWVKDRYFPNGAAGEELGDRTVIIDNWNEFGEGHFFMPSRLGGFGYLEAVGKVFGEPEHTDVRPKDTARLGHLYDQSRIERTTSADEDYFISGGLKDIPLIRWDFDTDTEGFTAGDGTKISVSDQALLGTAVRRGLLNPYYTKDPMIFSPDNLNISLDGNEAVHIRYRSPLKEANQMQVYFKANNAESFSKANSAKTFTPPNRAENAADGVYEDIYVDMSLNPQWYGTLNQIRIDPYGFSENLSTKPDDFSIDFIEIVSYDSADIAPEEYSFECTGFKDSAQNILGRVPDLQTDGCVEFKYTNPFDRQPCFAFAAEYDGGKLVGLYSGESSALITGSSSIQIPLKFNPGCEYRAGVWDQNMKPLIDIQILNQE